MPDQSGSVGLGRAQSGMVRLGRALVGHGRAWSGFGRAWSGMVGQRGRAWSGSLVGGGPKKPLRNEAAISYEALIR